MSSLFRVAILAVVLTLPSAVQADAKGGKTSAPAPQFAAAKVGAIPQSVFNVSANPKENRNPFFPNSVVDAPVQIVKTTTNAPVVESGVFVLNGITSPPRPTAMVNGQTFAPGEEGEVKTPNGKVMIKVTEIKEDSAIIIVGGVRRELRLRFL